MAVGVKDSLQSNNIAEAAMESQSEPAQVHRALRSFLRKLAEANTPEMVLVALSAFGAHFGMRYIRVSESLGRGATAEGRIVYVSPDAPQAVLDALRAHPLNEWARDERNPMFLSDADKVLALRGLRRASALVNIEGFLVNLEVAPGHLRHFCFFGEGALANGLSRSLLYVATLRAHQHLLAPPALAIAAPAVVGPITPTAREREVLDLVMKGIGDAEIGRALGMATRTVRFHLQNLARKFHVSSRRELIAYAAQGLGADQE